MKIDVSKDGVLHPRLNPTYVDVDDIASNKKSAATDRILLSGRLPHNQQHLLSLGSDTIYTDKTGRGTQPIIIYI